MSRHRTPDWRVTRREYANAEGFAIVDRRGKLICERTWFWGTIPKRAADTFERIARLPELERAEHRRQRPTRRK